MMQADDKEERIMQQQYHFKEDLPRGLPCFDVGCYGVQPGRVCQRKVLDKAQLPVDLRRKIAVWG